MVITGLILSTLFIIYEWILIARAVISWVQILHPKWTPKSILLLASEAVMTLTDPPLRFLRKFIKPLRVGNLALDMAFLVLFLLVMAGLYVVRAVFLN